MSQIDWTKYPNFSIDEMQCKHTGECRMHADFMDRLQALRQSFGRPMPVSSGYRSPRHPIEAKKATPGEHSTGRAADIAVQGPDALELIKLALDAGFTRVGVQQKGLGRFIHLGDSPDFPPGIWSY